MRVRRRWTATYGLALAAALLPAAAPAQPLPSDTAVRAILEDWIATGTVPGIVVGLLEPDGTRRFVAAGESGADRALDERSVFEIGSITKTFTGVLLAQMAEAGELTLDEPVGRLLPDSVPMPERGRPLTLLDLATHSSGLPRMPDRFTPADPMNPYADYTVADLYGFLGRHELRREPGAQFEYSNLGVGLLGHVLGLRADRPYPALLRDRILDPLGMDDTRIEWTADMRARLAIGHDETGSPVPNWDIRTLGAAGALRSTAADMLTYLAAHLDPPPTALGRAMTAARQPRFSTGGRHRAGLNWLIRDAGTDSAIVWHNGGTGGYHSWAGFMPSRGVAVVVLANSTADIDEIGLHLLDPHTPQSPPRREVPVAREVLARYVGTYELSPDFAIEVSLDGDRLMARATGQRAFPIFASSDSTFFLRAVPAEVTFQRDASGAVTGLVLHQNGRDSPGRKTR